MPSLVPLDVVSRDQIIMLCARALRLYDARLVDHGERVAFIAWHIWEDLQDRDSIDLRSLLLLSIFHDIGAFKTDEIDQMLLFENTCANVRNHSVYGYLFLKYFTPLADLSEAILYHHTPAEETKGIRYRDYANLIYLADRIDIAIVLGKSPDELFEAVNDRRFRREHLDALRKTLSRINFHEKLAGDRFRDPIFQKITSLGISSQEAVTYLRMLVYSIDFKSQYTVLHSLNTTTVSVFLARKLGLEAESVQKIYFGAMVHDLGKMAVPMEILEFPGRLNADQMKIMKSHARLTNELVSGLLPEEICHIAARHHEKLNGSGYPLGLTADQLTLDDRIVAVADIFSALVSRRSYKEPFDRQKTFAILQDMVDRNEIDAQVVALLMQTFEELTEVLTRRQQPILALYETLRDNYRHLCRTD